MTNYGTITGAFSNSAGSDVNGPRARRPDGINDGDGDGVDIDGHATIDNYGLIQGTGAGGHGSDGLPNTSEGIAAGGGSITNHAGATISGLGLGILIDDSSQGSAPFQTAIVNNGTISGINSVGIRIVSTFADTIVNNGTISGGGGVAILFGDGDNTLSIGADFSHHSASPTARAAPIRSTILASVSAAHGSTSPTAPRPARAACRISSLSSARRAATS